MDKSSLREQAKFHRDRIERREEDFESVSALFFDTLKPVASQIIAAYWPKDREFDARYILDDALKAGIPCALPIVHKDRRELTFRAWNESATMAPGTFGIMEPQNTPDVLPDIVIVPLLAFDRRGNRLGYGRGHYDATLAGLRAQKNIIAVGVGYGEQAVLFNLPVDEFDQKLDLMITPSGVMDFRNG